MSRNFVTDDVVLLEYYRADSSTTWTAQRNLTVVVCT